MSNGCRRYARGANVQNHDRAWKSEGEPPEAAGPRGPDAGAVPTGCLYTQSPSSVPTKDRVPDGARADWGGLRVFPAGREVQRIEARPATNRSPPALCFLNLELSGLGERLTDVSAAAAAVRYQRGSLAFKHSVVWETQETSSISQRHPLALGGVSGLVLSRQSVLELTAAAVMAWPVRGPSPAF